MLSTRSLLVEQQMQPLVSSIMPSSAVMIRSLSMPISPSSFTSTAARTPARFDRMWLTRVVLPLPRKPVTSVTGRRLGGRARRGRRRWRSASCGRRRRAAVEQVAGADRRLADPLAVGVGERVQRAPAGAVAGDDVAGCRTALSASTVCGMRCSMTPPRCRPPITAWIGMSGNRRRTSVQTLTMPAWLQALNTTRPRSRTLATSMRSSIR